MKRIIAIFRNMNLENKIKIIIIFTSIFSFFGCAASYIWIGDIKITFDSLYKREMRDIEVAFKYLKKSYEKGEISQQFYEEHFSKIISKINNISEKINKPIKDEQIVEELIKIKDEISWFLIFEDDFEDGGKGIWEEENEDLKIFGKVGNAKVIKNEKICIGERCLFINIKDINKNYGIDDKLLFYTFFKLNLLKLFETLRIKLIGTKIMIEFDYMCEKMELNRGVEYKKGKVDTYIQLNEKFKYIILYPQGIGGFHFNVDDNVWKKNYIFLPESERYKITENALKVYLRLGIQENIGDVYFDNVKIYLGFMPDKEYEEKIKHYAGSSLQLEP